MEFPTTGVAEFVRDLAGRHGVVYVEAPYDGLAEVITRLSGDEVDLDEVELLLFALQRAGVITTKDVVELQLNYLRERDGVAEFVAAAATDPSGDKSAPKNLDEWSARVLKNMARMATDEEYRREIAKKLS